MKLKQDKYLQFLASLHFINTKPEVKDPTLNKKNRFSAVFIFSPNMFSITYFLKYVVTGESPFL